MIIMLKITIGFDAITDPDYLMVFDLSKVGIDDSNPHRGEVLCILIWD
jgi:hypothetical protein